MALLSSEIAKIKLELGYNLLTTGAVPYIGISQVFEQVIQSNVLAGASTTSATAVTETDTPTPVTLTLSDGTGFTAGDTIVVDVDSRQEKATAQTVSGNSLTLLLSNAHTGTYPVTVEGGESIIREILKRIEATKAEMAGTFGEGAIKQVDEVKFYDSGGETFGLIGTQLNHWRKELSSALGVPSWWTDSGTAQAIAVY